MSTKKDPEAIYVKATKAELAKDWDLAFKLYLSAADDFLYLARTTGDDKVKTHAKSRAGVALQRAEKIKSIHRDLTPVVRNAFSEQSQLSVLKKSSRVNGKLIPLWRDPRHPSEDHPDQPELAQAQLAQSATWKFPAELCSNWTHSSNNVEPQDIAQRIISDCSVCASIVVCLAHHKRFSSKLGQSSLHRRPGVHSDGSPTLCLYDAEFHFNGSSRRIVIDDTLPVSPNGDVLSLSTGSSNALWPRLLEKAYLKLMGGYDFPGSNSGDDLHAMIGWIPDYVCFCSSIFQREKTWTQIYQGFVKGHCILTLGTPDRENVCWGKINLLPSHCYAVINISDTKEDRTLTILDSWESGSPSTNSSTFEMSWDEVCQTFEGAYFSWDPATLPHRLSFHGTWTRDSDGITDGHACHYHLRLKFPSIASPAKDTGQKLWMLLTRHVVNTKKSSDYIALRVENEFDRRISQQRIDQIAEVGSFTNSTHVLARVSAEEIREGSLSLIASYDGAVEEVGFTITAFSTIPSLSWDEISTKLPFSHKVDGTFTSKNAGGNYTNPSYMRNPQYHLRINPEERGQVIGRGAKSRVVLVAQTDRDAPLNISVVWSDGSRVFDLAQTDIVCGSGTYSYGLASASGDLLAGSYTVIVSAFEAQKHLGPFSLRAESSRRISLEAIPQEGAGMYSKVIKGSWQKDTAAGSPSSSRYTNNPISHLHIPSTCQIKIRLQLANGQALPSIVPALNVTVFPHRPGNSPLPAHITTSGPYSDAISGVVTPLVTMKRGEYLIIPSTFKEGIEASFRMEIFCTDVGFKVQPRA
ncbi:cysteine proteinase [Thelephora ganbajun]|uniref:Cysteine proteinase n=1 Tax=Thelephora ganbajun TaxID=370292 RepID=A0ACB6ZW89_THEGA|nr:cysteine proteinase [Thelephora ganbajun]